MSPLCLVLLRILPRNVNKISQPDCSVLIIILYESLRNRPFSLVGFVETHVMTNIYGRFTSEPLALSSNISLKVFFVAFKCRPVFNWFFSRTEHDPCWESLHITITIQLSHRIFQQLAFLDLCISFLSLSLLWGRVSRFRFDYPWQLLRRWSVPGSYHRPKKLLNFRRGHNLF